MRRKRQKQVPLAPAAHGHPHAKELEAMGIVASRPPRRDLRALVALPLSR